MRKIEQQMRDAVCQRRNWRKGNTEVRIDANGAAHIYLHGNRIAQFLCMFRPVPETFARWPTRTTAGRLRAMGINASIVRGVAHIDGKPVN
jgi:hypothetical protein